MQEIELLMVPFLSLHDLVVVSCSNSSCADIKEVADFTVALDGEIRMHINSGMPENSCTVIRVEQPSHAECLSELQRQSLLSLLAYLEKKAALVQ